MSETIQTIQTIYLFSASIGILAMIPQLRKLIKLKQSDGLSLTTWGIWACCQMVSLAYATSINAKAYMMVNLVWISFYWTMVFLIIKYRKRRGLLETLVYWQKKGRDKGVRIPFRTATTVIPQRSSEKV